MIELNHVSFGYGRKKKLFADLNLSLKPGHIYGLLGKNGVGKSSMLRLMTGLLFPDAGTVKVMHHEPRKRKPNFLQTVFFIPEEIYLPDVNIASYLTGYAPFYPNFNEEQFRHYLEVLDVPFDSKLASLSFGQKKKVSIAFGLAANTKILLMDEPTNALDIPSKSQFRKLIASIMDTDRLVLLSTHQVRDLENLIDNVIIMDEQQVLLNQDLISIGERLRFSIQDSADGPQILYAEPVLNGFFIVSENMGNEESKVDLEKLFNAAINNPERIAQIFSEPIKSKIL